MSLKDISTKFKHFLRKEHSGGHFLVSKAEEDEIYQVVHYRYNQPFKDSASLSGVEFYTREKYEAFLENISRDSKN